MRLITLASRLSIAALLPASCPPPAPADQDFAAASDTVGPNGANGFETPVNQSGAAAWLDTHPRPELPVTQLDAAFE